MENTIKTRVIKRNGEEVGFDLTKIVNAIRKANQEVDQLIEVYDCRDDVERMIGYKIERQLKRIERKEMIGKVLYE